MIKTAVFTVLWSFFIATGGAGNLVLAESISVKGHSFKEHSFKELRVGVVPWRETSVLKQMYQSTMELMTERLQVPTRLLVSRNYHDLGERLSRGAVDVAIFGPNSYVEAKQKYPTIEYIATVKQPESHYYSILFSHKNHALTDLKKFKDQRLALTDKGSTSGFLFPSYMLEKNDLNAKKDFQLFLLKKHYKVYDAVAKRAVDLGGANQLELKKAYQKYGDIFQVLMTSEPIPEDAVAVGAHLGEGMKQRVKQALIQAENDTRFKNQLITGYVDKGDAFYDPIRAVRHLVVD